MNTAELLTWINEVTALWWLIPAALSFICLRRRLQRHTGFTDQGWFLLFGHSRNEVFSLCLLLQFATLWFAVMVIGLAISFYLLPYGFGWFTGAVVVAITGILLIVPRWLG